MKGLAQRLLLATLVGVILARPAEAFDTGHHFDLTGAALVSEGFTPAAVRHAQIGNWVTDYLNLPLVAEPAVIAQFDKLHFDDLPTDDAVRAQWRALVANTRGATEAAARAEDPEAILALLGMSVHAVQDFYSHSNWVELHPRAAAGPFRTATYFADPLGETLPLVTSAHPDHADEPWQAHGDYYHGMNKDSCVRAGWDEAYVFADAATREWVAAMRGWAEGVAPGSWEAVRSWRPGFSGHRDLKRQVVAAHRLSAWGSLGAVSQLGLVRRMIPTGIDGHWKGNGSGSLVGTLLATLGSASPRASSVTAKAILLAPVITSGMATPGDRGGENSTFDRAAAGPQTDVPPRPMAGKAIIVRTLAVRATHPGLDPFSRPDFYARVTIGKQTFVEATQLDRSAITPAWSAIAIVPANQRRLPLSYALWDQDYPDPDDRVAITPGSGVLRCWLDPATGEVGGLPPGVRAEPGPDGAVDLLAQGPDAELRVRVAVVGLTTAPRPGN